MENFLPKASTSGPAVLPEIGLTSRSTFPAFVCFFAANLLAGPVIKKVRTGLGQSDKPFALTSHINLRQSCVCQPYGQIQIVRDLSRQIVENGVRSLRPNFARSLATRGDIFSLLSLAPLLFLIPSHSLSFAREFCEFCTTLQHHQQQQQQQQQRCSSPTAS